MELGERQGRGDEQSDTAPRNGKKSYTNTARRRKAECYSDPTLVVHLDMQLQLHFDSAWSRISWIQFRLAAVEWLDVGNRSLEHWLLGRDGGPRTLRPGTVAPTLAMHVVVISVLVDVGLWRYADLTGARCPVKSARRSFDQPQYLRINIPRR